MEEATGSILQNGTMHTVCHMPERSRHVWTVPQNHALVLTAEALFQFWLVNKVNLGVYDMAGH
jgi:hypothetical protein